MMIDIIQPGLCRVVPVASRACYLRKKISGHK